MGPAARPARADVQRLVARLARARRARPRALRQRDLVLARAAAGEDGDPHGVGVLGGRRLERLLEAADDDDHAAALVDLDAGGRALLDHDPVLRTGR